MLPISADRVTLHHVRAESPELVHHDVENLCSRQTGGVEHRRGVGKVMAVADPARGGGGEQSEDEWLADIAMLTIPPHPGVGGDELATAQELAGSLAAHARALLEADIVDRDECPPDCGFCRQRAGSCDLARDLARVLPAAGTAASASIDSYRAALARAGGAVFVCRRTLHPAGTCLFSLPGGDLCGRVLAATHRLG